MEREQRQLVPQGCCRRLMLLIWILADDKGHGNSPGSAGETCHLVAQMHGVFGSLLMLSLVKPACFRCQREKQQKYMRTWKVKGARELKLSTWEKINIKIPEGRRDLRVFSCSACVFLGKSYTPLLWKYQCTSEKFWAWDVLQLAEKLLKNKPVCVLVNQWVEPGVECGWPAAMTSISRHG